MRRCRAVSNEWEDLKQNGKEPRGKMLLALQRKKKRWGVKRQEDV